MDRCDGFEYISFSFHFRRLCRKRYLQVMTKIDIFNVCESHLRMVFGEGNRVQRTEMQCNGVIALPPFCLSIPYFHESRHRVEYNIVRLSAYVSAGKKRTW